MPGLSITEILERIGRNAGVRSILPREILKSGFIQNILTQKSTPKSMLYLKFVKKSCKMLTNKFHQRLKYAEARPSATLIYIR